MLLVNCEQIHGGGENGPLLKDYFEGGATWAFDVGSQSMTCPIIVEDLDRPRQMLVEVNHSVIAVFVELVFCDSWCTNTTFRLLTVVPIQMLCEDRGIFLEIADFIKGLGLTILRGVMEARKNKIWARFTVEVSSAMYLRKLSSFGSLWMQEHLILHAVTFDYTHAGQQGCD